MKLSFMTIQSVMTLARHDKDQSLVAVMWCGMVKLAPCMAAVGARVVNKFVISS